MVRYERIEDSGILNAIFNIACKQDIYSYDTINCFAEIRDFSSSLYEHSLSVTFLSVLIGRRIGKINEELRELFIAALLHDYGKIFIPLNILDKTETLTKEERIIVELHSIVGPFYLQKRTMLNENIINAILDHYEKLDGSGYGLHKTDSDISLNGKIIAITDVYDAMVTDRVYRKGLPKEYAIQYLQDKAGTYFEKSLTHLFVSLIRDLELERMERIFKDKFIRLEYQAV
jgi:HD-GYP domain